MSESRIHKAAPQQDEQHCAVCGQRVKRVPGGQGPTWVHSDSGAVAAPNPPAALPEVTDEDREAQAAYDDQWGTPPEPWFENR